MEDSLIVIFSIILAVILMFMFPLMDTWERQDDISYMSVYADVVEFVDTARNLGYISTDMYTKFLQNIDATGNRYDVTIEHRKRLYLPEGTDKIQTVYRNYYTNYIENILLSGNTNNRYVMKAGDYLYVSIKNTNKTQSTLLKEVIYASEQETFKIGVPYGGMVRNNGEQN